MLIKFSQKKILYSIFQPHPDQLVFFVFLGLCHFIDYLGALSGLYPLCLCCMYCGKPKSTAQVRLSLLCSNIHYSFQQVQKNYLYVYYSFFVPIAIFFLIGLPIIIKLLFMVAGIKAKKIQGSMFGCNDTVEQFFCVMNAIRICIHSGSLQVELEMFLSWYKKHETTKFKHKK